MIKRGQGRKLKDPKDKKDNIISFSVCDAVFVQIAKTCKIQKTDLSKFVRGIVMEYLTQKRGVNNETDNTKPDKGVTNLSVFK